MIDLDMPEDIYHAHPALSSTQARQLIRSPAEYKYGLTAPREPRKAWDIGTAVHTKVLGKGWPIVVIPDELLSGPSRSISSREAREWVAQARLDGLTPIKQEEADEVDAMAESALAHPHARLIWEQEAAPEVSVFGTDPETGIEIRARFDYFPTGTESRVAADLKTTSGSASPFGFRSDMEKYGYHVQEWHYRDALHFSGGHLDAFAFVVVEKKPPYLTAVHYTNQEFQEVGRDDAAYARARLRWCLDNDTWPAYEEPILLRPSMRLLHEHEDRKQERLRELQNPA